MSLLDIRLETIAQGFLLDFNQEDNEPMLLELTKLLHQIREYTLEEAITLCRSCSAATCEVCITSIEEARFK